MEHHTLDIIKRYKNVSKTWDKDPFSDFCQKIVQDEVDEYLEKHQIIEPNLDKVFDEMEDEKHSLETNDVYDWTKNDKIKKMMEDASTTMYHTNSEPKRTFLADVDKLSSTDWDEKSKKSNLLIDVNEFGQENPEVEGSLYDWTKIVENVIDNNIPKPDEGHFWVLKTIGEDNKIQHPVMDVIEKSPHYNTEVFPETIVMMEDNFKIISTMVFCKLNAFKYRMRTGLKDVNNIVTDVKKALNYEKRYKEFLTKIKNTFKQDKILPIMIGDEPFEVKVEDTDDYSKAILHIKSYLEQYNAKKTN